MRDQAIVQKVGNRSGMGGGGRRSAAQRPSKRETKATVGERLRGALGYFPTVFKVVVVLFVGLMLFLGYRAAASASFFQIRQVEIQGTSRASNEDVRDLVRRETSKTGVWNADLAVLSGKLERLPWIRKAVVSRVLPDGVRIRIVERVPVAVLRTTAGRFRWVDEEGVSLGELTPSDQMPAFFLRGLSEEDSDVARRENGDRVKTFLQLQRDADTSGISERISEVNLNDPKDVRVQLAGGDSQIELRLGSQDLSKRLQEGLRVLDQQRQTPRGQFISYIDLSYGKRVVGFISGAHISASSAEAKSEANDSPVTTAATTNPQTQKNAKKDDRKKPDRTERTKEKGRTRGAD